MSFNFLGMDFTKKIMQWVKNMYNFRVFYSLYHNLCGSHTFEKNEVIVLGGKKIVLGKNNRTEPNYSGLQFSNSESNHEHENRPNEVELVRLSVLCLKIPLNNVNYIFISKIPFTLFNFLNNKIIGNRLVGSG